MAESIIEIAKRLRAEKEQAELAYQQERLLEQSLRGLAGLEALDRFRPDVVEACKLAGIEISGEGGVHPLFATLWLGYRKNRLSISIRLANGDFTLPIDNYASEHRQWSLEYVAESLYAKLIEPYERGQIDEEGASHE